MLKVFKISILACQVMLTTYTLSPIELHAETNQQLLQQPAEQTISCETVLFTPPPGWRNADNTALPEHVKVMVVGKGTNQFPPSISLGTEEYKGTLKQYLKKVKEINYSKGNEWKDLGTIRTEAGTASLSQVDKKTEWGDVRLMHVIFNKNGNIYILTAASLKEEFPKFYKEIFNSLRSLRFSNNTSSLNTYKTPNQ